MVRLRGERGGERRGMEARIYTYLSKAPVTLIGKASRKRKHGAGPSESEGDGRRNASGQMGISKSSCLMTSRTGVAV